jgi:hypothetical protein
MGDSPQGDPPEGGFMQRVVTGIVSLSSARRPPQPSAATRRSASFTTPVTITNVSLSVDRSVNRPDPDAPRAETLRARLTPLPDEDSNIHPNVETRRGNYGGHYSMLESVPTTIQRQVQNLDEAFDALNIDDDDPPNLLLLQAVVSDRPFPPPAIAVNHHHVELDDESFFDTADLPDDLPDDDASRSSSQATSSRSFFGRLFQSPPLLPVVTPSTRMGGNSLLPNSRPDLSISAPESIQSSISSSPGIQTETISVPPTPVTSGIWYNNGPEVRVNRVCRSVFQTADTTPFQEILNGTTKSYTFRIASSPEAIEWALQVGPCYDLLHNVKGDLSSPNARHPPRLILIGRCRESKLVFGARVNLDNLICQPFPLLIRGTDTQPLVIVHPYLHGYHGLEDHSSSTRQGMYAVPTSWGGQRLSSSFALAWGLWADFKFRCQLMPHVLEGCSKNAKPSPQRTRRSGTAYNLECLRGSPQYGKYRPEIPRYILTQLSRFGIDDIVSKTSFRDLAEPSRGLRLSGDFALRETPETETPSRSSESVSLGGSSTNMPSPVKSEGPDHTKTRVRVIERIGKDPKFKIPSDHASFPRWALLLKTALLGDAWMADGRHILEHKVTTLTNHEVSDALSQLLFLCSTHGSEQIQNDFFLRGRGHTLLTALKGCEIYHMLDVAYRPSGAKWLWIWDEQWSAARHEQSESIASFRGRLEELVAKLAECGIDIPPKYLVVRLLTLACQGPYRDAFEYIQEKICVTEDPEWDLNQIDLDEMTDRLTSALRRTDYYGTNELLKKGKHPVSSRPSTLSSKSAGGEDDTDPSGYKDWMGQKNLSQSQASATLVAFHCVICKKTDHSHLDGHCPVLKKNNLVMTKTSSTNSSGRGRNHNNNKDPSGGSGKAAPVDPAKPAGSSTIRFGENSKPPSAAGTATGNSVLKPPASAPPTDPGTGKPVSGRQADAPSIGSESTHNAEHDDGSNYSDEDGPDWNMPNEAGVAAAEANRVRTNLASDGYRQAEAALKHDQATRRNRVDLGDAFARAEASFLQAQARKSTITGGRGQGGRGGRGRGGGGGYVSVNSPRVQAIDQPAGDIWTTVKIKNARKSRTAVNPYFLCADSGASRDLFTQREWFVEYEDIQDRNEFVVVADNTRVPIVGVGTVRFNLAGHEVQLRRVYHVPGLNGSLLSIRTHRRRGPGCTFLADQDGCHLTFPTFIIEIDDDEDVLIQCGPSHGGPLGYEQPHNTEKRRLRHAREQALRGHTQCRRSRIQLAAPHLVRPAPINAKTDLEETLEAVLPTHYVPESSCTAESKYSSAELHRLFGCRKFDYGTLPYLGDGLHVTTDREPPLTIGDTVNINRGARGGPVPRPPRARHTIGADIGYGEGVGPGGFKYCLFLVDLATRYTWVYGLADLSGDSIVDALWRFFVDAGGFPKRFRCDFDRRLIHGKVGRLLRSHGVKIGASPPYRHSQNGAVERNWNTAVEMGRSFLAEANLPKRYWFWAIREATVRMNILPVKSGPATDDGMEFQADLDPPLEPGTIHANLVSSSEVPQKQTSSSGKTRRSRAKTAEAKARQWSTPMELFYGVRPDYRILFRFGSVGYFRRTTETSGKEKSKFSSKSHIGIALGRSDYTNGMMFWDPTTSCFSVSSDFRLDPDRGLGDPFPGIHYDGGMGPSLVSGDKAPKEPFPPGCPVFALVDDDIYEGTVVSVPTPNCDWYSILPIGGTAETFTVAPCDLCSPDDPMVPLDRHLAASTEFPALPPWLKQDSQVTIEADGASRHGFLSLSDHGTWEFVQRDGHGAITYFINLADLTHTWRSRLLDGSLRTGWGAQSRAYHVHAHGLRRGVPGSFKLSMRKDYVDHQIWMDSYSEEYVSLRDQTTFFSITWEEYERKYSHVKIIPSMNVQTIKKDEAGMPIRAKSRVVALGNHEETIWEPGDLHAPVIRKESDRLLTSIAVDLGRPQKQGDCKNAFLHPTLPPEEIVIVRPPPGCPFSQPGELWLLNKTLYGLRRSPKHWYDALCAALQAIGMTPMAHDPCVFTGTLIHGGPLLYLGIYVDDFTYFSESDEVERIFEAALSSKLKIDWMGEVGWFLGKAYEWEHLDDGRLCVTITQTAKIEAMLEDLQMTDCNPVKSPYRSGMVIDSIPCDGASPESKMDIVKPYQRVVGGLNWLATSTRPDLCVCVSLLSQFSHNPSAGHLEAAKHVLKYLQGTKDCGIRFIQGGKFTDSLTEWVTRPPGTSECVAFTDANWGPQDASHPPTDRAVFISEESVRSLLGHVIIRCGGPVAWGCMREPKSSRSSCEAEIYCMDEGTKTVDMLRNIMDDLRLPDVSHPTVLYNDNRGSVDWSRGASLSKRLRHMNIREVGVRDSIRLKRTNIFHIPGVHNVADIFTKEHKSSATFTNLASQLIFPRLNSIHSEDPDVENLGPGGWQNNQLASRVKRGRIKGGVRTHLNSPTLSVPVRHIRTS